MPVSAALVSLNVSQNVTCINKLNLYIVPVCQNLPLDIALRSENNVYSKECKQNNNQGGN